MYLSDYCTVPMPLAGHPGDLDPVRPVGRPARWASRSRARRSARAGSSTPRTRSSRRSASRGCRSARLSRYEPVIGLEIHVQLSDADEDVLRLRAVLRRRAEHAHLPDLPRPPGHAAGDERGGGALRADDRDGARAARSRRARSSTARTTSIRTCRRATRSASTTSRLPRRAGSATCASTACTSRRTRRSSCTRASSGRIHGAETQRRRLQPRRHAAGRDRHRARPALAAEAAEFGAPAARDAAPASACPT